MEFLRGMGEMKPTRISRFAGINAPKYVSRFRELGGDLKAWETEGYLVSMPIPEEDKAAFDLESVAIPGSELIIFAMYRNDPQKADIAREFIELCKAQV